jgi:hypothetical protein
MEARADIQEALWRVVDSQTLREWTAAMRPPPFAYSIAGPAAGKARKSGGVCGQGPGGALLCVEPRTDRGQ